MRQHLHCGVDLGSTNVKIVLIDDAGLSQATRAIPTPRVADGVGLATDAGNLITVVEGMILSAWREVGAELPLRSITVAGVGEDGLGVYDDLSPVGYSIPWFDRRAEAEAKTLRMEGVGGTRVGINIGPDRTAAKWLWLKNHKPDELGSAHAWIALTDYLAVWWTGRLFMSNTLAARTACFDVFGRGWIEEALERVGAPSLPPLLQAGDLVGTVTRGQLLREGAVDENTAVIAGGHDHPLAAFAVRNIVPGARVDSMGTANLVYGEATGPNPPYIDHYLAFSVPPRSNAGVSCLGVFELSAALKGSSAGDAALMTMLQEKHIPGTASATIMLHLAADTPLRARLEYASFFARRMFESMDRAGAPAGPIFSTGGWANSTSFLELRASVFGQPVFVIDEPELTAVGCACVGAAFSTGTSPDLRQSRQMREVQPVEEWVRRYAEAYPEAKKALDRANADVS